MRCWKTPWPRARVINAGGGESHQTFFQPAVLSPVDSTMRVYHEEQFGPLVPVVPYRDLQEVIDYVTASDYGQQLSIFGNDPAQVGRLVDAFVNRVGRININAQCQRDRTAIRSMVARIPPKARCRYMTPCACSPSVPWWRRASTRPTRSWSTGSFVTASRAS